MLGRTVATGEAFIIKQFETLILQLQVKDVE